MFEIVEAIHKALRIESTWAFVLVIAFGSFMVGGFFAWVVDEGYKNSSEYKESHQLLAASGPIKTNPSVGPDPQIVPSTTPTIPHEAVPSKPVVKPSLTPPPTPLQSFQRVIRPDQRVVIVRGLSESKSVVRIMSVNGDREAELYAEEIADTLKEAGWTIIGPNFVELGSRLPPLTCIVNSVEDPTGIVLQQTFDKVGISMPLYLNKEMTEPPQITVSSREAN